jgi:hypothetical protein
MRYGAYRQVQRKIHGDEDSGQLHTMFRQGQKWKSPWKSFANMAYVIAVAQRRKETSRIGHVVGERRMKRQVGRNENDQSA